MERLIDRVCIRVRINDATPLEWDLVSKGEGMNKDDRYQIVGYAPSDNNYMKGFWAGTARLLKEAREIKKQTLAARAIIWDTYTKREID